MVGAYVQFPHMSVFLLGFVLTFRASPPLSSFHLLSERHFKTSFILTVWDLSRGYCSPLSRVCVCPLDSRVSTAA